MRKVLFLSVFAVYSMSFQCGPNCPPDFYGVRFSIKGENSTTYLDSVINETQNVKIWDLRSIYYLRDSTSGQLPWDPTNTATTFLFFSDSGVDTVSFRYQYSDYYDDRCERYSFEYGYSHVVYSSFQSYLYEGSSTPVLEINID